MAVVYGAGLLRNELAGDNRLLILGDFNMPNINWEESDLIRGANRAEKHFLDIISDCFLHQHGKEHIRFRNIQLSRLDLIFTKEENIFLIGNTTFEYKQEANAYQDNKAFSDIPNDDDTEED